MSICISGSSLELIHHELMFRLSSSPEFCSAPRGQKVSEFLAASFTLTDPRNRLITSPTRAVNYGFGVGELCWYLRGDDDLETMLYYNRRMSRFSDDGLTINSAYGARILNGGGRTDVQPSQWSLCLEELRRDPDSRRAVMHINRPADLRRAVQCGSLDVPCTMSIQLFIRNRRLHMHVLMRSNDVVWGLPYDVFSFTCLQEAFLYELQNEGVDVDGLGSYRHTAGSLHLYDTHLQMAQDVSDEMLSDPAPMAPFTLESLRVLVEEDEPSIRGEVWADVFACRNPPHSDDSIGWMYARLVDHWNKRRAERVAVQGVSDGQQA